MSSINSDYMSQMVLQSLNKTDADMTRAMQRLSTGKRINQAADDAAGGYERFSTWSNQRSCEG